MLLHSPSIIHQEPAAAEKPVLPSQSPSGGFKPIHAGDQSFFDLCQKFSFLSMLESTSHRDKDPNEIPIFNGHDLPQPSSIGTTITTDFYSTRPECVMERLCIEAAEKTLDGGATSERFGIHAGVPAGTPECFAGRAPHDPTFVLVDETARSFGHSGCLALCWVSPESGTFSVIPYEHPREEGKTVVDELLHQVAKLSKAA